MNNQTINSDVRIGLDLGGTKTEVIALGASGDTLLRDRVPTVINDYNATLSTIKELVEHAERTLGATGTVGIGTPGAISPQTGLLKNSNSIWLNGKPLQKDIEQCLQREVRLANDANCFALSEAIDGAARDAHVVFGVIVGTGTGGGIVVDKKLLTGPNAIAGEWGHNPIPWPGADELPGPLCYCGKRGCIETFLSGPGLSKEFFNVTGTQYTAEVIAQQAEAGDVNANAALKRYETRMAKCLASIINVLDPDVIVLGGGMSNIERLYHNVPNMWGKHVFSDTVNTRLVAPRYGDSSGVRGAAWLW
ncbi:MAG: ROK family protein [Gammaproteobacteria bacterium]|nr:ROK family protein [Gammaproteobacteria bacterium]